MLCSCFVFVGVLCLVFACTSSVFVFLFELFVFWCLSFVGVCVGVLVCGCSEFL